MGPKLLVLVWLLGAALAGPVSRNREYAKCSGRCTSPGHSKFGFEVGKQYIYSYEISNEISLRNSYEKVPALITGKAIIKVLEPCEMALQLEDVRIFHGRQIERGGRLLQELQRNPLYFAFNDGRIEHICPSDEDSHDSINIKRGVLSALQNTMDTFHTKVVRVLETDIMGTCETEYRLRESAYGSVEIVKTKDLSTCNDRQWSSSAVMTTQFDPSSQWLQNLRIRSDEVYQCVQIFKSGLLQEVECADKSAFKPFSQYKDEAQSEGKISLRFLKVMPISVPDPYEIRGRDSLLYAHVPEGFSFEESTVLEIIQKMCPKIEKTIKEEVPELYQMLVYAVARLPARTLERVYTSIKNGVACRSPKAVDMFLDALPMAGSAGAIELMVKLIQSNVITGIQADFWLTTLAFVPHPTEQAVAAVLPLIREPDARRQALLGISSMIYRFCSNRTDCDRISSVTQAVEAFQKLLGYKCSISGAEDEEKVIEVLKAFGNLGYHGRALETILDCAKADRNPVHVKVAALQAFRRGGCDEAKQELMKIYEDTKEDTEVRINAYMAVMKCPTRDIIQRIKDILEREEDEEVAVFTFTHLVNLQKTSAPLKQGIKELLENEEFDIKFTPGILNSRNIDLSVYSEHMKLGAEFESNFIKTQDSPIPRSLMANFSADLFGYNINFLECGLRLDGMDDAMDKLFGRGGMFAGSQVSDYWSSWQDSRSSWKKSSRQSTKETDASMFCRVFGNELALFHIPKLADFNADRAINIMNMLSEMARDHDLDFARSIMFLDTTVVIPSVTGRAYTLDLKGSGTVGLKLEGKFDVQGLVRNPPTCDIEGHLYPSATVEISAVMGLHSSTKPALKIVATLHTSNEVEAKLLMKNGRILNAHFNIPSEKVELFTFRYKVYNVDENGDATPVPSQSTHSLDHCTSTFDRLLGVSVCTELEVPRPLVTTKFPFIPLSGPIDISLYVKKTDLSVRGYEFSLELPDSRSSDDKKFRISFDTPGSKVDRKHSLEVRLMNPRSGDKALAVDLYTPYKQLEATVSYVNRADLIHGKVEVTVDKASHYVTSGSLEIRHRGQRKVIVPTLELNWPDMDPATLTGSITYSKGQKEQLTVDLRANKPSSSKPIYVKGTFINDARLKSRRFDEWRMSTDWTVSLPSIYFGIHGTSEKTGKIFAYDLSVQYQLERRSRQTLKLSSKFQDLSNRETTKITGFKEFQSSEWPEYNWRANVNWQKSSSHLENDVTVKYGRSFQDQRRYIRFYHTARLNDRDGQSNADNKIIIKAPQWNIDFEIKMDSQWDFSDNPSLEINSDISSSDEKKLITGFKFQRMSVKPLKMAVDAKVEYPGRQIVYRDSLEEKSPRTYAGKTYLQWQKDKHVTMDYDYSIKSSPQQFQHDVEATFSSPLLRAPLLQKASVKLSQSSLDVFSQTEIEGRPGYIIDARLSTKGLSEVKFNVPAAEGRLEVDTRPYTKAAKADVRFKDGYRRRIVASSSWTSKPKLALEAEVAWDADRDPVCKVTFSTELQTESSWTEKKHNWATKFRYTNEVHIDAVLKLDDKLLCGPHDATAEVKGKMFKPMFVTAHHEIIAGRMKTFVDSKQDNEQNFHLEVTGKYIRESSHFEVGGGLSLTSPAQDIDNMEVHFNHRSDYSRPSQTAVTEIRIQPSPSKVYTTNLDYSLHQASNGNIKIHWTLSTPHPAARPIQASLEAEYSSDHMKMDLEASTSSGKSIAWTVALERSRVRYQRSSRFITPGDYVMKGTLEMNNNMKYDVNGKLSYDNIQQFDWRMSFKSPSSQQISAYVRANKDSYSLNYEFGFQKGAVELLSGKAGIVRKDRGFTSSIELHQRKAQMLLIEVSKEVSRATVFTFKAKGPFTPIHATLQWMSAKNEIQSTLKICHTASATNCNGFEASYKNDDSSYGGKIHRELKISLLNEKLSRGSMVFVVMNERKTFHSKLLVEVRDKKIGYEMRLDKDSRPLHNVEVTVYLPSREIQVKGECALSMKEASAHLEVFTDVSRNSRKKFELDASYRNEKVSRSHKIEVEVKINYPNSNKPFQAKLCLEKNSQSTRPFIVKAELDYAKSTKGKLTAMAFIETVGAEKRNQSINLMVYREDRRELDILLKAHIAAEQEKLTIGYLVRWNHFGEYRERFFLVDWSVPDEHLNVWYRSPKMAYEALGTYTMTPRDGLKIDFEAIVNGKQGSAKFEVDMHKHCVELSIYKASGERIKHYEACLGGHCILSFKADSFRSGQKITDISLVVENTGTKFYSVEADWDPDNVNDVADYVAHLPQEIYDVVKKDIPSDLWQQIFDESDAVYRAIIRPVFHSAKQEAEKIWYEIEEDIDAMMRVIGKIYRKSEILSSFIDDVITALKKVYAEIKYEFSQLVKDFDLDSLLRSLKRVWKCIVQSWEDYWNQYCTYNTLCYKVKYAYRQKSIKGVIQVVLEELAPVPDAYYKIALTIKNSVWHSWSKYYAPIRVPLIKAKDRLADFMDSVKQVADYIFSIDLLQDLISSTTGWTGDWFGELKRKVHKIWYDMKDKIAHNEDVKALIDVAKEIKDEVFKEVSKLRPRELYEKLYDCFYKFGTSLLDSDTARLMEYDPVNGHLKFEILSPEDLPSFRVAWKGYKKLKSVTNDVQ